MTQNKRRQITTEIFLLKKSPYPTQGQSGSLYEILYAITDNAISCACIAFCCAGVFAFLWTNLGPTWPEAQPRCRSPPPLFRLLIHPTPKWRKL